MHIHIHIYIYICIQTIYIYSNGTNHYNSCTQGARQPVALWQSRMAFRSLCWSLWRWIMAPLLVEHVIIKYVINIVLVFYNHHIYNHHIGYWCSHLVFLSDSFVPNGTCCTLPEAWERTRTTGWSMIETTNPGLIHGESMLIGGLEHDWIIFSIYWK